LTCRSGCTRYVDAERQFGSAVAARDLARYRRKGPDPTSRLLLEAVGDQVTHGDSLLDIGAGVGVLDFELLTRGISTSTLVDASPAYLEAAHEEAGRRQVTDRLEFVIGDFTNMGGDIARADVITMHRVICCYPDCVRLLEAATGRSRRLLAFSYPRDKWYVRFWLAVENLGRRMRGNNFRTFVHSPAAMEGLVGHVGFARVDRRMTFAWCIDVYARSAAT
jgi:magnesium-protoporphyrin O-methyltransferase